MNVQTSNKPLHQLSTAESKNKSQDHRIDELGTYFKAADESGAAWV